MKDPTRRQIMMMADEANITDYEAAARLVRLVLAAFRPVPIPEQLAQIIYEQAMVAASGPQGRFWPSWAELPESDARAHAMAAAGAILAAWGRPWLPGGAPGRAGGGGGEVKFNRIMLCLSIFLAGSCFGMNVILLAIPATRDKPVRIAWATTALLTAVLAPAAWRDQ